MVGIVSCQETPKPRFTVGIVDDVTHLSLPVGEWLNVLPQGGQWTRQQRL